MELRIATVTDADAIIACDHVAAREPARVQFIHDQVRSSTCYVAIIDKLTKVVSLLKQQFKRQSPHGLLPLVQRKADMVMEDMKMLGHPVRIVEGYRSPQRQAELYAQGRTTPGDIVTRAQPGESLHQYGVAVDFVFKKQGYDASDELWQTLGVVGERHGFEWGGAWKGFTDKPHFQLTLGYNLHDFMVGDVDYSRYN